MIFSFIEQHRDLWPVTLMCNTLGVSPAGFYAWLQRPKCEQQQRRDALLVEIRAVHAEVKHRYGSPKMLLPTMALTTRPVTVRTSMSSWKSERSMVPTDCASAPMVMTADKPAVERAAPTTP